MLAASINIFALHHCERKLGWLLQQVQHRAQFVLVNRPGNSGDSRARVGYWKVPVSTISRA